MILAAVSILRRWGSSRSSDSVATRQIHFRRPALDSRWFLSWFLRYAISFVAIAPFRREFVLFFPYNASVEFLAKEKSYFVDPASFPGDIQRSTVTRNSVRIFTTENVHEYAMWVIRDSLKFN